MTRRSDHFAAEARIYPALDMHKYTASSPACSAVVGIANDGELLITRQAYPSRTVPLEIANEARGIQRPPGDALGEKLPRRCYRQGIWPLSFPGISPCYVDVVSLRSKCWEGHPLRGWWMGTRGVPETCICSTPDYTLGRMWAAQIAGKLRDEIAE
jgi:hypothetical protein